MLRFQTVTWVASEAFQLTVDLDGKDGETHALMDMVQRVYSHMGAVRHRSDVVEFRIEQHRKVLAKRLKTLSEAI